MSFTPYLEKPSHTWKASPLKAFRVIGACAHRTPNGSKRRSSSAGCCEGIARSGLACPSRKAQSCRPGCIPRKPSEGAMVPERNQKIVDSAAFLNRGEKKRYAGRDVFGRDAPRVPFGSDVSFRVAERQRPGDGLAIVWFAVGFNGSGNRTKWFDSSRSVDKLLQIGVILTPRRHVLRPVDRA